MSVFFQRLATELLSLVALGNRLIAIDGVDGSGKTAFAEQLAAALREQRHTVVLHADDFLHTSSIRHGRGRTSPLGFFLDTYDYEALAERALDPLGLGGSGTYAACSYDLSRDARLEPEWQCASPETVVLVEGMFLHRAELREQWAASIFLDVPFGETVSRMASRDGTDPDPEHPSMRRYVQGQRIYFAREQPWERATYVVDNTDFFDPRIIGGGGF